MKLGMILSLILISGSALANDGGQAAIKASEIKMREYEFKNGQEVEKKRYTNPNFRIFINGDEAKTLQQILPSTVSVVVIGMMQA